MADDSKRSKLSLPSRPADAPSAERRTRPPLRGSSKPRPPKPAERQPREERAPRAARGFDDRPRGGFRDGERGPDRDRGFGEGRSREGQPPRREGESRGFGERPPRSGGDRAPRESFRGQSDRGFGEGRPRREGGDRGFAERSPRAYGERREGPQSGERRSFSPRPEGERRGFGDRLPREEFRGTAGRNFDERRPREDRPPRREGDRPARSFVDRGPQGRDDRRPAGARDGAPQRGFRDDGGDRRFGSGGPMRQDGERGSRRPAFEGRDASGERRPAESRTGYGREGERRGFSGTGDRPARDTRGQGERDDGHREERRPYGERPAFRDGARPAFRQGEERPARPAFRSDTSRSHAERPRRDPDRDGPAPAPTFGDDILTGAPRGNSFGRSRAEARPERLETGASAPAAERPRRPAPPERYANAPAVHPEDAPGAMRLSKRMSELGLCSRREADEYIERGWVTVDGEVVAELGAKVTTDQKIELNAVAEEMQLRRVTILINKPIGYVSGQAEDGYEPAAVLITPENHWTDDPVRRRFESRLVRKLAPAGRLDIDSTGLLVLTQDGRVAKQLIGEYSSVEKEYLVRVEGELSEEGMRLLHHGLTLDGVELLPAKVSWQNEDQLRFVLQEGRKRQIRRMCEMVGLKVVGLKRIRIGRIPLGKLPVGQWRYLGEHEEF